MAHLAAQAPRPAPAPATGAAAGPAPPGAAAGNRRPPPHARRKRLQHRHRKLRRAHEDNLHPRLRSLSHEGLGDQHLPLEGRQVVKVHLARQMVDLVLHAGRPKVRRNRVLRPSPSAFRNRTVTARGREITAETPGRLGEASSCSRICPLACSTSGFAIRTACPRVLGTIHHGQRARSRFSFSILRVIICRFSGPRKSMNSLPFRWSISCCTQVAHRPANCSS
jgi:hypothetical protein